jgi:hypothetical protein
MTPAFDTIELLSPACFLVCECTDKVTAPKEIFMDATIYFFHGLKIPLASRLRFHIAFCVQGCPCLPLRS